MYIGNSGSYGMFNNGANLQRQRQVVNQEDAPKPADTEAKNSNVVDKGEDATVGDKDDAIFFGWGNAFTTWSTRFMNSGFGRGLLRLTDGTGPTGGSNDLYA